MLPCSPCSFFFNDTATTEIYTLSLHDALPIYHRLVRGRTPKSAHLTFLARWPSRKATQHARDRIREITGRDRLWRSEEHTSELQSHLNLVCRLLLEKKKYTGL